MTKATMESSRELPTHPSQPAKSDQTQPRATAAAYPVCRVRLETPPRHRDATPPKNPAVAARSGSRPGTIQGMIDGISLGLDTTIDSPVVRKLVGATIGAGSRRSGR